MNNEIVTIKVYEDTRHEIKVLAAEKGVKMPDIVKEAVEKLKQEVKDGTN